MRLFLLLILGITAIHLNAQNTKSANKCGWEISASFAPDLDKTIIAENIQVESIPENIPISQRLRTAYDTVMVGGANRLFYPRGADGPLIKQQFSLSVIWPISITISSRFIVEGIPRLPPSSLVFT